MTIQYIDTQDDIDWLRSTHCPDLPNTISCAIITGNEDAPERVEAWVINNPPVDTVPDFLRVFVYGDLLP